MMEPEDKKDRTIMNTLGRLTDREQDLCTMAYKAGRDEAISSRQTALDTERHIETIKQDQRHGWAEDEHTVYMRDAKGVELYREFIKNDCTYKKVIEFCKVAIGIGIILALLIK